MLKKLIPTINAEAHCDIPCGIYDATPAKIAAKTVARMIDQLLELQTPKDSSDAHAMAHYIEGVNRRVEVKEQHAETCKRELQILWSDFFKQEHLEANPDLHTTFWNALKLCSKNKQEIDKDASEKLVSAVDEIAKIFYTAKGDPDRFKAYQEITDKLY